MQSKENLVVGKDWVSVNAHYTIVVGTKLQIQNKGDSVCLLAEGVEPASNEDLGVSLYPRGEAATIPLGSREIWARSESGLNPVVLNVQEV